MDVDTLLAVENILDKHDDDKKINLMTMVLLQMPITSQWMLLLMGQQWQTMTRLIHKSYAKQKCLGEWFKNPAALHMGKKLKNLKESMKKSITMMLQKMQPHPKWEGKWPMPCSCISGVQICLL